METVSKSKVSLSKNGKRAQMITSAGTKHTNLIKHVVFHVKKIKKFKFESNK